MPILINEHTVDFESSGPTEPTTEIFDVQGYQIAEYRLTELDQTDPKGRFRLRVSGGALEIHRATKADWADWEVMVAIDTEGVSFTLPTDDRIFYLKELLREFKKIDQLVSLAVE